MTDNKSNQRKPRINCLDMKKAECCSQCGKEGVDPKFSKYLVPALYYTPDIYICDDCPTIWVVYDIGEGKFHRQELSRDILKEENILPF